MDSLGNYVTHKEEKCVGCTEKLTSFLYRDLNGWRCDRCAPSRRPCQNQPHGCTYTDTNDKCSKHEEFFCPQATQCSICWMLVPPGTLSAHYASVHQDITHMDGAMWRATGMRSRWCLVSSVAGTAVCWYWLQESQFLLDVRIPAPSERLHGLRCEVLIADPATGYMCNFTPEVCYDTVRDWFVVVEREELPSWSTEFDVCLDIKIKS